MKAQVEAVLKKTPASCAIATTMENRLHSKELQNSGATLAITFAGSGLLKGATTVTSNVFRIGRALSGAEAMGLTGMALGATTLGDNFRKYNTTIEEASTVSGLGGDQDGKAIHKIDDIVAARDNVKMSLFFAPIDGVTGWATGKTLYSSLSKQMSRDLPELAGLQARAKLSPSARDAIVDKWLGGKITSALNSGTLSTVEKDALQKEEARNLLNSLTAEIEKNHPKFFQEEGNVDFLLKVAATQLKKEKNDPSDLGEKAKELMMSLNANAMDGKWDPIAQKELLTVFGNAVDELRLAFQKDPATYAKFSSSPEAQQKIMASALRNSGAKEEDIKMMSQCVFDK